MTLLLAHSHDVLFAKLERMDERDVDHMKRILDEFPMSQERIELLSQATPYATGEISEKSRRQRFERGLNRLRRELAKHGE